MDEQKNKHVGAGSPSPTKSDEDLMEAYRCGDLISFEELYQRYSGRAYGFILKKINDPQIASEIFQEVFLKLHRYRRVYDQKKLFAPWFFVMVKNTINDALRSRLHDQELTKSFIFAGQNDVAPKESGETLDAHDEINKSSLSKIQKESLFMRYLKGLSFFEIAKVLKTTPENARQIISRAVKKLKSQKINRS